MKKCIIGAIVITGALINICCSRSAGESELDRKVFATLEQIVGEMDEKASGAIEASHVAAKKAEAIFRLKKEYGTSRIDKGIYYKDDLGILSDHGRKMQSNIYVGKDTPLDDYAKWYIKASEEMIPTWEENFKKYPYLGWQYLTDTKYTSNRFFPWFETTMSMGANAKWRQFDFYKCVTPENDPERELRWSMIGPDILGLGLISPISVPIYVNGEFVAVSSIDFLITKIFKDYLYREHPGQNSYLMLVNRETLQVILRNDKNEGERGWDMMFDYGYLDKLAEEKPDQAGSLKKLADELRGKTEVFVPNKKVVYFQKLKNADWVAAIVTE